MVETITAGIGFVCLAAAVAGCVFALCGALAVRRLALAGRQHSGIWPGVSILKPLSGATPGLYDDLASFCDQDYRGPLQVLFGVKDPTDAAVGIVKRLIAERPGRDLKLVVHGHTRGPNPKIGNLAALEPHIKNEVVVIADADISAPRNYLGETISSLAPPGVGAVTLLYRGVIRGGIWARLASMGIDYDFLPNVLIGLRLGLARPCFGSTIALRRETLAAIGGLRAFANYAADDYAIGAAVRAAGLEVAIPFLILGHTCSERSTAELLTHELRWARTIRVVSPLGYAGTVMTRPVPMALIGSALTGFGGLGMAVIAAGVVCRLILQLWTDRILQVGAKRWLLGPARDLLAFGVYVASYFVDVVKWRGRRYQVRGDGTLIALGDQKA